MKKFVKPIIFGVVCLILSAVITIQLRITGTSESASSQEKITDNLKDQIFLLNEENTKLTEQLQKTTNALTQARAEASENDITSLEKSSLIKKYYTFLGYTDVYGEGLSIKYTPSKDENRFDIAQDLRYIVNELKNVGVEAISINGQRLVNTSSIEVVKNKIEINGQELKAPYTINVIGDSNMINNGITRPGGIVDLIKSSGVQIKIELKEKVEISKFSEV